MRRAVKLSLLALPLTLALVAPTVPTAGAQVSINDTLLYNSRTATTIGDDVFNDVAPSDQIVKFITHGPGPVDPIGIGVQNQSGTTYNFLVDGCPGNGKVKVTYTNALSQDVTAAMIAGLPILNKTGGSTIWFDAHPKVKKGVNRGKWTCDLWANVTSTKSLPDYVRLIVIVKP